MRVLMGQGERLSEWKRGERNEGKQLSTVEAATCLSIVATHMIRCSEARNIINSSNEVSASRASGNMRFVRNGWCHGAKRHSGVLLAPNGSTTRLQGIFLMNSLKGGREE